VGKKVTDNKSAGNWIFEDKNVSIGNISYRIRAENDNLLSEYSTPVFVNVV
jgi:hypothetical protein